MSNNDLILTTRVTLDDEEGTGSLALKGRGVIEVGAGRVLGRYLVSQLPDGMHPRALGIMTLMGHAQAGTLLADAMNPFVHTSHTYRRTIDFGEYGSLVLNANCVTKGKEVDSQFKVSGEVHLPDLVSMEPLIESWIPAGPGVILGNFSASWTTADGGRVVADCATRYELASGELLKNRQHRYVSFRTAVDGSRIAKLQRSTIFRDFPSHDPGSVPTIDFADLEAMDERVSSDVSRLEGD